MLIISGVEQSIVQEPLRRLAGGEGVAVSRSRRREQRRSWFELALGMSRGGLRATKPRRSRKGTLKPGEKPRGCKLTVPESVFERLRQTAIKCKASMSVVAAEVLDRNLPYFEIVQRDKPVSRLTRPAKAR